MFTSRGVTLNFVYEIVDDVDFLFFDHGLCQGHYALSS
jgi:hypothetical protein